MEGEELVASLREAFVASIGRTPITAGRFTGGARGGRYIIAERALGCDTRVQIARK